MSLPPETAEVPDADLLDRARHGDQEAWQQLFDDCYPKIVRVVRHRLNRQMRRYYDSTDIANSVMKSLAEKFDRFDFSTIDGLKGFLVRAAEQKLIDGHRRIRARRRDDDRNRPLDPADAEQILAGNQPTPSQVAVAVEGEQMLLDGIDGVERQVVELRIQGHTTPEVAKMVGWNERKVQRFLEKLRGVFSGRDSLRERKGGAPV